MLAPELEEAKQYWSTERIPVLPLAPYPEKKPLVLSWQQWQTQKQVLEDLEGPVWDRAEGVGVVCGTEGLDGKYLVVIDVDSDHKESVKRPLPFQMKMLPSTRHEQTPGGGFHFYYWSNNGKARGRKNLPLGVELLSLGNYCRVYEHSQETIATTEDPNELFQWLVEQLGGQPEYETVNIKDLLKGVPEGKRDWAAIRLCTYYRKQGKSESEITDILRDWNTRNSPPMPNIEHWITEKVRSAFRPVEPYHYRFLDQSTPTLETDEFFTYDGHGNKHFEPVKFAKRLIAEYKFKVMEDSFDIFVYNPGKGIWENKGSQIIRAEMGQILGEENRKRYVQDVEHAIICYPSLMVPRSPPLRDKIAVLNGILNLRTATLDPPNPEEFIVTQLPVKFDSAATCPTIDKFITEIVTQEMKCLLLESSAYCLWQDRPIHKATLAIGEPESGKSTFLKLLTALLGHENVSTVPLQTLCDQRFASAELYLKLANISADLPKQAIRYLGVFKMAVGGDPITGEYKHGRFFTFLPYAKHFYSCNSIPETREDSNAYYRRWNIIEFPNVFTDKRDVNLDEKLQTPEELSGWLNQLVKLIPTILERKTLCVDEATEEIRAEYILKSNSVHAFIEAKLETSLEPKDEIDQQVLYREYGEFCKQHGVKAGALGDLTRGMRKKMPGAELKHKDPETSARVWRYVKWKPEAAV